MVFVNNQPDNVCSQQLSKINLDNIKSFNEEEEFKKLKERICRKDPIDYSKFDPSRDHRPLFKKPSTKNYLLNSLDKMLSREDHREMKSMMAKRVLEVVDAALESGKK